MAWAEHRRRAACLGASLWVCSALAWAQAGGLDLEGHRTNPLTASLSKVVVLVFLRRDCPVSARYAPAVQQISQRYADVAQFWLVYPDKTETPQAIRKSVSEYGYQLPVLLDPDHVLVKASRVRITPEVAVFDRSRRLIYDGRIDDWYIDLARARPRPTTHELEKAIQAAAAGSSLARNEVRGVGCYISDLE
jgi:thiol-disulfide isomerase/thioredoxin